MALLPSINSSFFSPKSRYLLKMSESKEKREIRTCNHLITCSRVCFGNLSPPKNAATSVTRGTIVYTTFDENTGDLSTGEENVVGRVFVWVDSAGRIRASFQILSENEPISFRFQNNKTSWDQVVGWGVEEFRSASKAKKSQGKGASLRN